MRKLASIQKIKALEPIENADAIEKATVLGWQLVVKKDEFKVGDLCDKKQRIKEYKAKYFQENKERIKARRKNNPVPKNKQDNYYLKSRYGLDRQEVDAWFTVQKGKCMICDTAMDGSNKIKKPHIDHCHESGNVRGLLCHNCNTGLGHFKDNTTLLKKAIKYLGGIA